MASFPSSSSTSSSSSFVAAKASAPGKVILFGEHAVVYGITAIAAALSDLRIVVEVVATAQPRLDVRMHDVPGPDGEPFTHSIAVLDVLATFDERPPFTPLAPVNPDETILDRLKHLLDPSLPAAALQGLMAIYYLAVNVLPEYLFRSSDGGGAGLALHVRSEGLPIGAGLGSSAAFSVALAAALLRARQATNHDVEAGTPVPAAAPGEAPHVTIPTSVLPVVNGWAYAAEVVIHGAPSGLDNTTSCYGGVVRFRKGDAAFDTLPHQDLPEMKILLTNTRVPRSTKLLVAEVRRLHDAMPAVVAPVLTSIEAISRHFLELVDESKKRKLQQHSQEVDSEAAAAAAGAEFVAVSELFRVNHDLLCALGVGHRALTAAREASSAVRVRVPVRTAAAAAAAGAEAGAEVEVEVGLQCKLTGAGGGGCAITLLPPPAARAALVPAAGAGAAGVDGGTAITDALRASLGTAGFDTFESGLAGGGARWHEV